MKGAKPRTEPASMTLDPIVQREDFNPRSIFDKPREVKVENPTLRTWSYSEKYPFGFPNDVVLYMPLENLRELKPELLLGIMPAGYNILIHRVSLEKFNKKSFGGNYCFVITNFERGDDKREYFHANPATLEETVNNPKYRDATESFINAGIAEIQLANAGIRSFIASHTNQQFSKESLDMYLGRYLSHSKFYVLSIEGIGKMLLSDDKRNNLNKVLNSYLQTKEDFEAYQNKKNNL